MGERPRHRRKTRAASSFERAVAAKSAGQKALVGYDGVAGHEFLGCLDAPNQLVLTRQIWSSVFVLVTQCTSSTVAVCEASTCAVRLSSAIASETVRAIHTTFAVTSSFGFGPSLYACLRGRERGHFSVLWRSNSELAGYFDLAGLLAFRQPLVQGVFYKMAYLESSFPATPTANDVRCPAPPVSSRSTGLVAQGPRFACTGKVVFPSPPLVLLVIEQCLRLPLARRLLW